MLLQLQGCFTGYKLGSRRSKSSISLPGLVLKQNCHEHVTKGTSTYCFVAISRSAEYKPNIFSCKVFYFSFFLRKTDPQSSNYLKNRRGYAFPDYGRFCPPFGNEIPLTINHGREMSTISGNEPHDFQ